MALPLEQVRWVAHLARLKLTEAEEQVMARDLGAIVEYVNQLQLVNTDNIEPLAHALDLQNVFRADEPVHSLTVEAALANAPAQQGDFYAVPAVLD